MKISFVSTQAISSAMRYQTQRMQADLVQAQQEVVSGKYADVGVAIGARAGYSFSLEREVDRLNGLMDSNALAKARLSSTQLALRQLVQSTEDLLSGVTTAMSGASETSIVRKQAEAALSQITSVLNSNLNGEYLFAGINTDARPITDFTDPNSPNRIAFDNAFAAAFADPSAITEAEMTDFLENVVNDQFFGAGWADWSTATDQQIVSRITLSETAVTSVSANVQGVRKVMMAAATISAMFDKDLSLGARNVALDYSLKLLGSSVSDLANEQSFVGITEQRIENANERLSMQSDLFSLTVNDLQGVDPYEASTRVSTLLAQIEVSYTLTSRMQNLSLVRFLR
jgi:flagellar hook-associated protein 3 FlgL